MNSYYRNKVGTVISTDLVREWELMKEFTEDNSKFTKLELLHALDNIAITIPMTSPEKLGKFYELQRKINSGEIRTPQEISEGWRE